MRPAAPSATPGFRAGIDIGGTFTDIVLLGGGQLYRKKISSSVDDYSQAIVDGLKQIFGEEALGADAVTEIRHGTTVGSNAILERKGARTGLIGTRGFRDILEIRTLRMPQLYDMRWEKPPPLVERDLRVTVDERIDANGIVQRPLDVADAERAVRRLVDAGVQAIAICLLNSFANPVHELVIKRIVQRVVPGLAVCASFEVLPEIKEYERTSTTVINAVLKPVMARYLRSVRRKLDESRVAAPVFLMQSNGGLMTSQAAIELPIHIVESGPAGGVIGAQALARAMGLSEIITFDMGGTTAKASLIEGGGVTRVQEYEVGGGIISGTRLLNGGGYALKVPAIDIAEVGAGGGSIIRIDVGGSMRVGPESAGASPGPAAYDLGGEHPTITDASIVLGYINPDYLVGGGLRLNAAKARTSIEESIAKTLGLTPEEAAHGAHRIVAANMTRAIKSVSSERGRDPRDFTMFAFGGNGPLFAAGVAAELGIRRVVIPPAPGLFSSFGLLWADVEHHFSRTLRRLLREIDLAGFNMEWDRLASQAVARLEAEGYRRDSMQLRRSASLHYRGQTFELTVPLPEGAIDGAAIAEMEEAFGDEHERTYGHRAGPGEPVMLVTIHLTASVPCERSAAQAPTLDISEPDPPPARRAYFGADGGWRQVPVLRRRDLGQTPRPGPLIVEEYDATCVVPPSARAMLDAGNNIVVEF